MRWSEVDTVWTVPASRIKAGKEHRLPLTGAAVTLLGEPGAPEDLVFPSTMRPNAIISDMGLTAVLRRMKRGDLTVHGFRSTFRDRAGETTAHRREVIEATLAHQLKDKAEAAYARGDLFQKRRRLMEDWATHLSGEMKGQAPSQRRDSREVRSPSSEAAGTRSSQEQRSWDNTRPVFIAGARGVLSHVHVGNDKARHGRLLRHASQRDEAR